MFTEQQLKDLAAPLDRAHVRERKQGGRSVSYIEAWHAIAEANRIFGFDGWNCETTRIDCVSEREGQMKSGEGWFVTYNAKVRVTVYADDRQVVREGCGSGHGIDKDLGQSHESAIKEAESDALKRALMKYGNQFGLALYDKEQRAVMDVQADQKKLESFRAAVDKLNPGSDVLSQLLREFDAASLDDVDPGDRQKFYADLQTELTATAAGV